MYYGFIGCIITIVVGLTVSLFSTFKEEEIYDEKLIHPFARKVASLFPGPKRRYADKTLSNSNSFSTTPTTMSTTPATTSNEKLQNRTLTSYSQDVPLEDTEIYNTKL